MIKRDNFSEWQKQATFSSSAQEEKLRGPDEFERLSIEHYICPHCHFVGSDRRLFEVDHRVSCKEGGNANREALSRITRLQSELDRPLDKQDLGVLMSANVNDQLFCKGCNQSKKSAGMRPDDIPAGSGFAYRRHDDDESRSQI
jgi:hypothetical protein